MSQSKLYPRERPSFVPDPRAPECLGDVRGWLACVGAITSDVAARAGSERAAEGDVRKPVKAARPSAVRRSGERQARARGNCGTRRENLTKRARFVVVEHARRAQRELTCRRAERANIAGGQLRVR